MIRHFWTRWSREYIYSIRKYSKWHNPRRNIVVGDVVILQDDNLVPRNGQLQGLSMYTMELTKSFESFRSKHLKAYIKDLLRKSPYYCLGTLNRNIVFKLIIVIVYFGERPNKLVLAGSYVCAMYYFIIIHLN